MKGSEYRLREYRRDDHEAMYALDVACFDKPFRFSRRAMLGFAEAKNARVVIATDNEILTGFGILHVERTELGRAGYLVTLDVAAEHRRNGLARALMRALEDAARAADCSAMALHVFIENVAAIRFYEHADYRLAHGSPGFYGRGLDALVYHKNLT